MGRTVLIVDDDAVTLKLLKGRLASAGFEVIQAETGRQALDQAADKDIDAVVMDIMLPDMEGSEVVAFLKNQEKFKSIKVVFLSGIVSADGGLESKILVAGVEYPAIGKPVDLDVLLKFLRDD